MDIMRGIIMGIDTNGIIAEYINNPALSLKDTCNNRLLQLNMMDRNSLSDDELKEIKEEIRSLCYMLHMIEVFENKDGYNE